MISESTSESEARSVTPNCSTFGKTPFSSEEKQRIAVLLQQKLGVEDIATRPGPGGVEVTYVEGWKAVNLANNIFGYDGWSSSIVDITPDFIEQSNDKFKCGVTAVVRVMLKDGSFHEDVGYGCCENKTKATALENAKKEAVTDARKRALRLFGNHLGNCLYDKEHLKKAKQELKTQNSQSQPTQQSLASTMKSQVFQNKPTNQPMNQIPKTYTPTASQFPQQPQQAINSTNACQSVSIKQEVVQTVSKPQSSTASIYQQQNQNQSKHSTNQPQNFRSNDQQFNGLSVNNQHSLLSNTFDDPREDAFGFTDESILEEALMFAESQMNPSLRRPATNDEEFINTLPADKKRKQIGVEVH